MCIDKSLTKGIKQKMKNNSYAENMYEIMAGNVAKTQKSRKKNKRNPLAIWALIISITAGLTALWFFYF